MGTRREWLKHRLRLPWPTSREEDLVDRLLDCMGNGRSQSDDRRPFRKTSLMAASYLPSLNQTRLCLAHCVPSSHKSPSDFHFYAGIRVFSGRT